MLAAVLDHAGGLDLHPSQAVPEQLHHHCLSAGRLPQLLQFRYEPHLIRFPQRQLQKELLEGVHMRGRQGGERHAAHGELRLSQEAEGPQ